MKSAKFMKNRSNLLKILVCAFTATLCMAGLVLGALPTAVGKTDKETVLAVEADGYASFAEGSTYKDRKSVV